MKVLSVTAFFSFPFNFVTTRHNHHFLRIFWKLHCGCIISAENIIKWLKSLINHINNHTLLGLGRFPCGCDILLLNGIWINVTLYKHQYIYQNYIFFVSVKCRAVENCSKNHLITTVWILSPVQWYRLILNIYFPLKMYLFLHFHAKKFISQNPMGFQFLW